MRTEVLWTGLILGGAGLALAQDGKPAASLPGQPTAEAKSSPEEQAIRTLAIALADDAFVRDYNKGDTKALVARFTEDAEVVEEDGARYRGHGLIEQRLAETFAASPGVKLQIDTDAIQFLSPDVVKAEGRTVVTPAKGSPEVREAHGTPGPTRWPLADLEHPRGTRPADYSARPAQGAGLDARRVGR